MIEELLNELDFQTIFGTIVLIIIAIVMTKGLNDVTDFDLEDMLGPNYKKNCK